jgi:hypothetical protein
VTWVKVLGVKRCETEVSFPNVLNLRAATRVFVHHLHLYRGHPVAYFANYSIIFVYRLTQHAECVTLKLIYLFTITTCFDQYFGHHQVNIIIYRMFF